MNSDTEMVSFSCSSSYIRDLAQYVDDTHTELMSSLQELEALGLCMPLPRHVLPVSPSGESV